MRTATRRLLTALLVSVLLLSVVLVGAGTGADVAGAQPAAAQPAVAPGSSRAALAADPGVQILGVTPALPVPTSKDRTIRFNVRVTAGSTALTGVQLDLERGNPLINEKQLTAAVAAPPETDDVDIPSVPVTGTIEAQQSRTIVLTTTVDRETEAGTEGLCLSCNPGVYPVDVSLTQSDTGTELARTHTYIPSFQAAPQPVGVSWIWPLLERPHRSVSRTIFDDDDLARSVAPNGRLWRALRVPELLVNRVRLTVVIDPDLIDALMVMSGSYQVRALNGSLHPGTGSAAARSWLTRLADVVRTNDIVRTPYADPDVDTLARNNLTWTNILDAQVDTSLQSTLGTNPGAQFSWPVGARLSGAGLDSVVTNGAAAVVLLDTSFPSSLTDEQTPDALAPLPSASGTATAVVLSSALQATVAQVTSTSGTAAQNFSSTQLLYSQLAVRAVQDPGRHHYVALAPARYVDADPVRTATVMKTIATSTFSTDESVAAALNSVPTVDHGPLTASTAGLGGLPSAVLALLADTRSRIDAFRECLSNKDAATLLSAYPAALSRGESVFWRDHRVQGQALAGRVRNSIADVIGQVRITSPPNASYTLASSDAPLFITVENKLAVTVRVALRVEPAPGERGLVVRPIDAQIVPPGTHQFKMSTHVERTGKFKVVLTLVSPTGKPFGVTSQIRVKSTAFGAVGLWITGVAFGALILALAIRTVRRIQHRTPRPPREVIATPTGALS